MKREIRSLARLTLPWCLFIKGLILLFGQTVQIKSEIWELEKVNSRFLFSGGDWEIVGLDVRKRGTPVYQILGLRLSWLTAGPLCLKGLLREVFNPLAYSTGSSVFAEEIGIDLDKSFEGGGRRGMALSLVPGYLTWFLLNAQRSTKTGLTASLPFGEALNAELLLCTSHPPRGDPGESWHAERPLFPGGRLVHGAARLSLDRPTFYGVLSAGFSGGERTFPGFFSHSDIAFRPGAFEMGLNLGLASNSYFDPNGRWNGKGIAAGLDLWLLPFDFIKLGAEYGCIIDHAIEWRGFEAPGSCPGPPGSELPFPELPCPDHPWSHLNGKEIYSLKGQGALKWGKGLQVRISSRFDFIVHHGPEREPGREEAFFIAGHLVIPPVGIDSEYSLRHRDGNLDLRVRFSPGSGFFDLSLFAEDVFSIPGPPNLGLRMELKPERSRIFLLLEKVLGRPSLSMGLEVEMGSSAGAAGSWL
ncbi:MAG TPA: hypothetical protein VMX75_01635 [Spirochaetia bacterium]|nr:hypothetical protein [Spirochaetia bacterium]